MLKLTIHSSIAFVLMFCCYTNVFAETITLNNPTNAPLTTQNRDGLLDQVVGKALENLGYSLKLVRLPAERGLKNANSGIDDGDLSRISGLEKHYPNLIRVPEKIYDMNFAAFTRSATIDDLTWQSLSPHSVGLIRGWKILETGVKDHPNVLPVRNADILFEMIKKNRADIVLYSQLMGLELAKSKSIKDIRVLQPPLVTKEMFIYLHKKHKDLVPKLANEIRQLKSKGFYQKIYNEKLNLLK